MAGLGVGGIRVVQEGVLRFRRGEGPEKALVLRHFRVIGRDIGVFVGPCCPKLLELAEGSERFVALEGFLRQRGRRSAGAAWGAILAVVALSAVEPRRPAGVGAWSRPTRAAAAGRWSGSAWSWGATTIILVGRAATRG